MKNENNNNKVFLITGVLFLIMFVMNYLMPYHRDDYDYAVVWHTPQHLSSFGDVILSCWRHYVMHGGRMLGVFVEDFFLWQDKLWFDLANTMVFVAFVILIYMHGRRAVDFKNPGALLLAAVLSWLCFPHFGEVAIWKCGAVMYLWTGFFAALFLLPYNLKMAGRWPINNALFAVAMFFFGILAGWSIENLGVTVAVISIGLCWYCHKQGTVVPTWMITGATGAMLGLVGLLVAPGNWIRYNEQGAKAGESLLVTMSYHVSKQFSGNGEMLLYILPALLLFVVGYRLLKAEYLKEKCGIQRIEDKTSLSRGRLILLIFIVVTTVSYFTTGFVGKGLHDILEAGVLIPLGLTRPKTLLLFANLMDGFDEMAVYWCFVFFMFSFLKDRFGLSKEFMKEIKGKTNIRELAKVYPELHYALFLIVLALFNNFVMIAAPTFPGRATFSSTAMIVAAVVSFFDIAVVREQLFSQGTGKILKWTAAFLVAFTVLSAVTIMYNMKQENDIRLAMVIRAVQNGEKEVIMPPIMARGRALRHVYFEDFYNNVTVEGLCNYYGINKITVRPLPPWAR